MRTIPQFIEDTNLSVAWARAFLAVMGRGVRGLAPLVIHVTGFQNDEPRETAVVRTVLDGTLTRLKQHTCHTVANTIFPQNRWENYLHRGLDRHAFFARYRAMYPRLRRRSPENRSGLYFGRMVDYGRGPEDGNQLEHIIKNYVERGIKRPTAMVVNIFEPARDHTAQRRRGFPCLNRVEFTVLGKGQLAVKADYPCQYLFERGYGNYLGLCRLGKFMARELKLELTQLTCTVGIAMRGEMSKQALSGLEARLRAIPEVRAALAVQEERHANAG
jgi:hypothetical protein